MQTTNVTPPTPPPVRPSSNRTMAILGGLGCLAVLGVVVLAAAIIIGVVIWMNIRPPQPPQVVTQEETVEAPTREEPTPPEQPTPEQPTQPTSEQPTQPTQEQPPQQPAPLGIADRPVPTTADPYETLLQQVGDFQAKEVVADPIPWMAENGAQKSIMVLYERQDGVLVLHAAGVWPNETTPAQLAAPGPDSLAGGQDRGVVWSVWPLTLEDGTKTTILHWSKGRWLFSVLALTEDHMAAFVSNLPY